MFRLLWRGLAYIGLCLLTAIAWLPMRYFGIIVIFALPFEFEWTARAVQRGDLLSAIAFGFAFLGTIIFAASMVWLRAWIMQTWDEMTGIRWIWRW